MPRNKEKTWGHLQAETILKDAKVRHGAGWAHLSQAGSEFHPAQDLARQVFEAMGSGTEAEAGAT